jgi:glycosyltransferase involved in cell wall biosynthesis
MRSKHYIKNHRIQQYIEKCSSISQVLSLLFISYQFESYKSQDHWKLTWSLISGSVRLINVRASFNNWLAKISHGRRWNLRSDSQFSWNLIQFSRHTKKPWERNLKEVWEFEVTSLLLLSYFIVFSIQKCLKKEVKFIYFKLFIYIFSYCFRGLLLLVTWCWLTENDINGGDRPITCKSCVWRSEVKQQWTWLFGAVLHLNPVQSMIPFKAQVIGCVGKIMSS